jgi:hypothetical protein
MKEVINAAVQNQRDFTPHGGAETVGYSHGFAVVMREEETSVCEG